MSERADDDVRGEQRKAARQLRQQQQQQQLQQGEGSTAMATVGERRSLPSPEIMLGQPWSSWVDAAKLHGNDGAESEESLKECGKNREAMRLCREDMPIFGQCPAQDDFYLVMCNHCSQVVKPQAFQAHYERRHGSSSKPPPASTSLSAFPLSTPSSKNNKSGGGGGGSSNSGSGSGSSGRSSSGNGASSNSKILKPAKEKLPSISGNNRPMHMPYSKVPHDKIMTPSVKVEKMPLNARVDGASLKPVPGPTSSTTVSSSIKPGLNCPSIPKPPLLSPGQIPNGKGLLSTPDKKQDDSNISNKRQLHKRLSEREFNPDFHCGVLDLTTRKPCTRSLTCKTHSLSQRRAVLGRRKRFDALLAEHKSKTREKELHRNSECSQQTTPLREPHPPQETHQISHGNNPAESKPSAPSKAKPHNPSLPRPNIYSTHPVGNVSSDPASVHESPHHSTPAAETASRLSSDEGENEEKEDTVDKLDCHYSCYHPRPAAFCSFGSRQFGRSCYAFDRRWDRVRYALSAMVDKHVNSQMWKKIPPVSENTASTAPHKTSTSSLPMSHYGVNATGFLCPSSVMPSPVLVSPPYAQSFDSKSILSYGTTLSARTSPLSSIDHAAYNTQSRQVSSSPQMPSGHSAVPSLLSSRPQKSKPSSKSFRSKEPSATITNCNSSSSSSNNNSSSSSNSSGKKRKNSSPLPAYSSYSAESPSFKKNCAVNSGSSGSMYHASVTSSSHGSVHNTGLNCSTNRTNSLSLKHDQSGRGPPSGSPAESIKRMSVVMKSSDSTLSLGPFVHQSTEQAVNSHSGFSHPHAPMDRLEGKKRKGSPASSSVNSSSSRPNKVAKSPGVNNIHAKHGRTIPGTQGLPNNSLIQQPKARP
uniref:Ataxin 7 n=1 Tax=Lepisosteus oculatus TaxID=7918 RepID=W5MW94_LEPOC|nr:PREDICTED: ataxin-7 isoform X2 [Lepisosteus oculatus]XP_015202720.1 PREDICTED: ataxin-7 isoform X2 [Lepisosteus oculatus]XP_015202721.1 PREDICTED: ataxin-7 isoform X2 [Lepisosteus oculatus]XP_015202722.1 PREDICTED: ataxin-7 isoform X2 [Lepisosteus oculatus]